MKRALQGVVTTGRQVCVAAALAAMSPLVGCAVNEARMPPAARAAATTGSYPIVGTGQRSFWNSAGTAIEPPLKAAPLYGQDAQFPSSKAAYRVNSDGTVSDLVTGLMWTQSPDLNGDGVINGDDKLTVSQAVKSARTVTAGGYRDWRLPTIKELYSLITFTGGDPRIEDTDTSGLKPFIDTDYFTFSYGDTEHERIIDAQFATSTLYVGKTAGPNAQTMFGVNFADGRIKGYGTGPSGNKRFFVYYVRGNPAYGDNSFHDNSDGTVTDLPTGLMWSQADSGVGMNWESALAWVQKQNERKYLGYDDWRLPDIKTLQSIVDYSRAPGVTGSAAIDPVFQSTEIRNEAGEPDDGCFWSSTTHLGQGPEPGARAAYICFGRAMGKMFGAWRDVHGAGAQRSDPKAGYSSEFPNGRGPQGDAIRIDNFVRLVRSSN